MVGRLAPRVARVCGITQSVRKSPNLSRQRWFILASVILATSIAGLMAYRYQRRMRDIVVADNAFMFLGRYASFAPPDPRDRPRSWRDVAHRLDVLPDLPMLDWLDETLVVDWDAVAVVMSDQDAAPRPLVTARPGHSLRPSTSVQGEWKHIRSLYEQRRPKIEP